jgi:hypothetical protein
MSDTPRTDAAFALWDRGNCGFDYLQSVMRKLERENAALRAALEKCINTLTDSRLGKWRYMEGREIYTDFKTAADNARAALEKQKTL